MGFEEFGESRREKSSRRQTTRKPAAQRQASQEPRPRRKLDLDAAPEGYDANVWELAGFFEHEAESRGFELAAGRPVLYAKLIYRIDKSGIREVTTHRGQPLKWFPMLKVMIMDFWDDEVLLATVRYAADQFCGVETFAMLRDRILSDHESKDAHATAVRQVDRSFRDTPAAQRRIAERQQEPEDRVAATRPRSGRSWEEIRDAVRRINGKGSE